MFERFVLIEYTVQRDKQYASSTLRSVSQIVRNRNSSKNSHLSVNAELVHFDSKLLEKST